jgi:Zn-dependent protease with chaperone function
VADLAGYPLLIIIFSLYTFALKPVTNNVIWTAEAQADRFGLDAARQPDAFASAVLKLGLDRKLDPGPLEEFLFLHHPSGRNRIQMAMEWKAKHLDELSGESAR